MTFLQPWLLLALPLLAIPIIVHLVHLRRYQSVPWAAMKFLLAATKMSSGYSKLRQWLILAMRSLAIAALVFFTSRPLANGITGWLAGDSEQTTILIVDRSPSMQSRITDQGQTKQQLGIQRFVEWNSAGGLQRVIAIATGHTQPIEYKSAELIASDPQLSPCAITSNIPAMLEQAREYLVQNNTAKGTIWICSDLRDSDWRAKDGSWAAIREAFSKLNADIRFQVMDLSASPSNRSLQLLDAKQLREDNVDSLSLSFRVVQQFGTPSTVTESVPLEVQIGDARSVVPIDLVGGNGELKGYRIPLAKSVNDIKQEPTSNTSPQRVRDNDTDVRWGAIQMGADSNLADNIAYFCIEPTPPRRTLVISDNPSSIDALSLCAAIPPDPTTQCTIETIGVSQLDTVDWDTFALVVWHDQLPEAGARQMLERFMATGGQVLFVPPDQPNSNEAFGFQWRGWETLDSASDNNSSEKLSPSEPSGNPSTRPAKGRIEQWRNDSALLGNTLSGSSLPLGELGVFRLCTLTKRGTELASLQGDRPLLVRSDLLPESSRGSAYALCTTPSPADSTLAKDGISMYIIVQRLLEVGMERVGDALMRDVVPESLGTQSESSMQLGEAFLSTRQGEQSGVFVKGRKTVAQNRTRQEDDISLLNDDSLKSLFGSLRWYRVETTATESQLVQEIWRWFVAIMLVALLLEAFLSLPSRATSHRTAPK